MTGMSNSCSKKCRRMAQLLCARVCGSAVGIIDTFNITSTLSLREAQA